MNIPKEVIQRKIDGLTSIVEYTKSRNDLNNREYIQIFELNYAIFVLNQILNEINYREN